MILQMIYMFLVGFVNISVEGFFIERFINICRDRKIILNNLCIQNNTYLKVRIPKDDFVQIKNIAKKTKCKVKIERKVGLPFIINKYRKRKIFLIAIILIAIFIFIITKFVWNIEVVGNNTIPKEEIIELVNRYGIKIGELKNNINTKKICNLIMIDREDIAWLGITIKGTNVIINIKEASEIPEIIDRNEICDIVSNKDAIISKIIVQNGTARVKEGDIVKQGDLLVEGIMESEHMENRLVHSEATIYGKNYYTKSRKELFLQNNTIKSGKEEKRYEICINNFKLNFNKRLSKFENYDTINESKKIKIFSNYYFPLEIRKTTNFELKLEEKNYQEEELKDKIISELKDEFEQEYSISKYDEENVKCFEEQIVENNGIYIKLTYELQEEIGTKVKRNLERNE